MAASTSLSAYVLEYSVPPGGARLGEVYVYARPEMIVAALGQRLRAAADLVPGARLRLGVYLVAQGRVSAFVDLRPTVRVTVGATTARLDDAAACRALWPRVMQALGDGGDDEVRVEVDAEDALRRLPPSEGPCARPGTTVRLKADAQGRRHTAGSYLATQRALPYGFSDLEGGAGPPPGFVDPDPPAPPVDPLDGVPDAALLRAVFAAPEADEPRMRYAAALEAAGDPRGEFVRLQLQRARSGGEASAVERRLLAKHAASWGAPLLALVEADGPPPLVTSPAALAVGRGRFATARFERGFVTDLPGLRRHVRDPHAFAHPAWSLVRSVAWTPKVGAAMTSLRVVGGPAALVEGLAALPHPLDHVALDRPGDAAPDGAALAFSTRSLHLKWVSTALPAWLRRCAGVRGLTALRVDSPRSLQDLATLALRDALHALPTTVREFTVQLGFRADGVRLALARTDAGAPWDALVLDAACDDSTLWYGSDALADALRDHPVDRLTVRTRRALSEAMTRGLRDKLGPVARALGFVMAVDATDGGRSPLG